jgi:integrase
MMAAGVTKPVLDEQGAPRRDADGRPLVTPKYTGLHALRHFYASWCINRKADGGLELPAKVVQHRLGHSSIVVTMQIGCRRSRVIELSACCSLVAWSYWDVL